MKKSIHILACLFPVLSCSVEAQPPYAEVSVGADVSAPIGLSSAWSVLSKGGGEMTTESIRTAKFGLFAWWNRQEDYFDGTLAGHQWLENSAVTYIGTAGGRDRWACDPGAWWPLGCHLSFFAYAPYMDCSGPMLVFPGGGASAMPGGVFTQDPDPARQVDFCMSYPVMDRSPRDGDVPLEFWHALTRVLFYVNAGGAAPPGDGRRYRVKSLRLDGIVNTNRFTFNARNAVRWDGLPRSDLSLRTQSYSLSVAAGTLAGEPVPFVWDVAGETGLDQYLCINGAEAGRLYLLPQPMTAEAVATLEVEQGYWEAGTWTHTRDMDPLVVDLPVETVWKPRQTVAYTLTLDVAAEDVPLEFSVTVQPWGSNSIEDIEFPTTE